MTPPEDAAPARDEIVRFLVADDSVRVVATVTTELSREAARRHGAVGGTAVALARGATAGLLLATLTKGGERVTLQILGDGPLGGLTADATDEGDVRAYVKGETLVPGGPAHRVSLAEAVGRNGIVNVIRDLGLKERYSGQSPLVTGEIDEDVETYLRTSEQIESALGCEAVLDAGAEVCVAGGILVQCMPGDDARAAFGRMLVRETQHRLRTGELYDALVRPAGRALDALDVARIVVGDLGPARLLDRRPVRFFCPCSRERVIEALFLLGEAELAAMVSAQNEAEVFCNFCGERYAVSAFELEALRQGRHGTPGGAS